MNFGLSCLCVIAASVGFSRGALPADWKKCSKADMGCYKDAVQGAIKSLSTGNAAGLPSLDPLKFAKVTLLDGKDGRGKLEYNDISVKGLTGTTIEKVEAFGNNGLKIFFNIPHFDCLGKYVMNTKLLGISMNGDGDLEMNFGGIKANIEFTFAKKNKGGKMVYVAETAKIKDFSTETFYVYHHNLFNGNKQLEESINKSLNDDWKGLVQELLEVGKEAFGESYLLASNSILEKFTADDFELPSN